MTEVKLCKGDVCGSYKSTNDLAAAIIAVVAIGALVYAYHLHRNKGSLKAALRFLSKFQL